MAMRKYLYNERPVNSKFDFLISKTENTKEELYKAGLVIFSSLKNKENALEVLEILGIKESLGNIEK